MLTEISKSTLDSNCSLVLKNCNSLLFGFFNTAVTSLNNMCLLEKAFNYSSLNEFQQLKKWSLKKKFFSFHIKKQWQFSAWKIFPFTLSEKSSVKWRYFVFFDMHNSLKAFVYLDVSLKTVLYILARGIIRKQCKSWLSWFPHPCILVQSVQKFLYCGRGIKPNNLKKQPKCILLSNSFLFPPSI